MGDQLEGDEEQHMKYREMVVHYIVVGDATTFCMESFLQIVISVGDFIQSR